MALRRSLARTALRAARAAAAPIPPRQAALWASRSSQPAWRQLGASAGVHTGGPAAAPAEGPAGSGSGPRPDQAVAEAAERVRAALAVLDQAMALNAQSPAGKQAREAAAEQEAADEAAEKKAARRAQAALWVGLAGLLTHWGVFARLTYYELSWDVMEPAVRLGVPVVAAPA